MQADQWPGSSRGEPNALLYSAIYFFMKFILARKDRMTQIFDSEGRVHAGTVLKAGPIVVTQVKAKDAKDGYSAVQVGFEVQTEKRLAKAQHAKAFKVLKEFTVEDPASYAVGNEITLDTFTEGETVRVVGTSKGKGFSGVVKRHGFHGGRRSHGQKHSEREAGSIGGGGRAGGRVAKGMRMAGRMGGERVVVPNLKVLHINQASGEIIISGAVPGPRGSLVEITTA